MGIANRSLQSLNHLLSVPSQEIFADLRYRPVPRVVCPRSNICSFFPFASQLPCGFSFSVLADAWGWGGHGSTSFLHWAISQLFFGFSVATLFTVSIFNLSQFTCKRNRTLQTVNPLRVCASCFLVLWLASHFHLHSNSTILFSEKKSQLSLKEV